MIYIAGIVGIVILALGGFGAWQKYRADAAVAEAGALEARAVIAEQANAGLTTQLAGLNADANRFRDAATRAQARAAKALKDAKAREEQERSERDAMEALLSHPPSTEPKEVVCARADDILRGVVRDSLRND